MSAMWRKRLETPRLQNTIVLLDIFSYWSMRYNTIRRKTNVELRKHALYYSKTLKHIRYQVSDKYFRASVRTRLTLTMLNLLKNINNLFIFSIVYWIWLDSSRLNQLLNKNTCCLSYTATCNFMSADALATLGAIVLAGMLLSPKVGLLRIQRQKS